MGLINWIIGNKASNKATNAQTQAITEAQANLSYGQDASTDILRGGQQQSYEAQLGQLGNIQGQNQPYMNVGAQGLLGLSDMAKNGGTQNPEFSFDPSQVTHSPVFAQIMADAMKALNRSTAGRGRLLSGGTAQELTDYAKKISAEDYAGEYGREFGLATQKYNAGRQNVQDQYSRLLGLSDIGERATARTGEAEENFGNQVQGLNERTAARIAGGQQQLGGDLADLNLRRGNVLASGYGQRAALLNESINDTIAGLSDFFK